MHACSKCTHVLQEPINAGGASYLRQPQHTATCMHLSPSEGHTPLMGATLYRQSACTDLTQLASYCSSTFSWVQCLQTAQWLPTANSYTGWSLRWPFLALGYTRSRKTVTTSVPVWGHRWIRSNRLGQPGAMNIQCLCKLQNANSLYTIIIQST